MRVQCSGRLGGAEMSRKEWYREGRVPLHTLRADVDYGLAEARTTFGRIGVKVWIYKGEILPYKSAVEDKIAKEAAMAVGETAGQGPASTRSWRPNPRDAEAGCLGDAAGPACPGACAGPRRVGMGRPCTRALEKLKTLEQAAKNRAITWSIAQPTPRVHPRQLFGIEIDPYAHELASIVVWIGYLQWKYDGIATTPRSPCSNRSANVHNMNAIVMTAHPRTRSTGVAGRDVIVRQPAVPRRKAAGRELKDRIRGRAVRSLGRARVARILSAATGSKGAARSWRASSKRAGLLATQAIPAAPTATCSSASRRAAISSSPSPTAMGADGAAVHVSMVGFDDGREIHECWNGAPVEGINADLTAPTERDDRRGSCRRSRASVHGRQKAGPFEISGNARRRCNW